MVRIIFLYHPDSDHARAVDEYAMEFSRRHPGRSIEKLSLETIDGSRLAQLYGVVSYPALVVLATDGQMQQLWEGGQFPLMDQIQPFDGGSAPPPVKNA